MAKKNPWQIATFILIGVLVLGGITGLIAFGKNAISNNTNTCPPNNEGKFCYDKDYKSLYDSIDVTDLEKCRGLFGSDYPIINQMNTIKGWAEVIESTCSGGNSIGCMTYGEENSERIISEINSIISSIKSSCR